MTDPWGKLQQSKVRAMARNIGDDPSAMLVYCALISLQNNGTKLASASYKDLAILAGRSTNTVIRSLKKLLSCGMVAIENQPKGRSKTDYRFPDQRWVR